MRLLFWISVCFIFYTYVGYPFLLFIWSKLAHKQIKRGYITPEPMVSVIIAARNEEKYILQRIKNILTQEYPICKLQLIIVSDGSTDATNSIVKQFIKNKTNVKHQTTKAASIIKLIELSESKGKSNALNVAFTQSQGEYIVFADTRQQFEPNAIKELIANFLDPSVGCVSGELVLESNSDSLISTEIISYWNLEKRIRKMESMIHSPPGATGAIYAIRSKLFQPLPDETLLDDVYIPMKIVLQGYRTIFDSRAIAFDTISQTFAQEKRRKVRTLVGNYQLLNILPKLLSPASNPIFLRYLSHKVFRLFVPFFFIPIIFSALFINAKFYTLVVMLLIITSILSLFDSNLPSLPYIKRLTKLIRSFLYLNYFALLAAFYILSPSKKKIW